MFVFFNIMEILFPIFFIIIFGIIIYTIVSSISEWARNNNSPIEEKPANIVGKREETRRHSGDMNNNTSGHRSTSYYASFEFEDRTRKEFTLSGKEYGLLAEGDLGILKYQGTRYLEFDRK